jgi:tripartite-type tricarboxylate transporter receptor subunit TctC
MQKEKEDKMKRLSKMLALGLLVFWGAITPVQATDFPVRDINGIIQWGAGGTTDLVSRAVTPAVEKMLGRKIVLTNRPGATGAIATQFVFSQPADGYTILYGAENPQIYKVLELAPIDYTTNFTPINILARGIPVIVCNVNEPWKTVKDLFDDAKKTPGRIKMGTTGVGGVPHVVGTLLRTVDNLTFNQIPFEGDGPGITALLGGHTQFTVATLTAVREHIRAGRLRALAIVSDRPVPGLEAVPLITTYNKEYDKYLPWGPFFGVFVRKETPDPIKKRLTEVYLKASQEPAFQELVRHLGGVPMGIAEAEAERFIRHWQSVTSWLLHEAGAAKSSPEKFGIPRP